MCSYVMNVCCVVAITLQLNGYVIGTTCPDLCECRQQIVRCNRDSVPGQIPDDTEEVFIESMNLNNLRSGVFRDRSWRNLSVLVIFAHTNYQLSNQAFVGLDNLRFLGIHGRYLYIIQPHAFEGLDNVHTLDFSLNSQANFSEFLYALDASKRLILPSLKNLSIADTLSREQNVVKFNTETMRYLSVNRSITYLDISGRYLGIIDIASFEKLFCNSLKHFKVSRVSLALSGKTFGINACVSLRTLDLSETRIPSTKGGLFYITCHGIRFINNVTTLIASGMIREYVESDLFLDLRRCNFHLKKIVLRNNNLKRLNLTVNISDSLRRTLSELDFSSNIIEYLAPNVIYPSTHLETLNLTSNRLSLMQLNYHNMFEKLLSRSYILKNIYLAYNMLQSIPKCFFANNHNLKLIDISGNKLNSLTFDIYHLVKLEYLDLHGNLIHAVDETTRAMFSNVYIETSSLANADNQTFHSTTVYNTWLENATSSIFHVNLGSNPFRCNCEKESLDMLDWLDKSVLVYRVATTYTCMFEDETFDIIHSVVTTIKDLCDHMHLVDILIKVIPSVAGAFIIIIVTFLLYRRRRKRAKQHQYFVQNLKHNRFRNKFLVFLSFCSEDSEFVLENIANQLKDKLSEITKNRRNFVGIGDHEFKLGLNVHEEVMRCMEVSSVVMFIVSNTFCQKNWCRMEVSEAYNQQKPIIMFMKERVETEDMPKILRRIFNRYTHAAWVDDNAGGHCEPSVQIICESIIEMARGSALDAKGGVHGEDIEVDEI